MSTLESEEKPGIPPISTCICKQENYVYGTKLIKCIRPIDPTSTIPPFFVVFADNIEVEKHTFQGSHPIDNVTTIEEAFAKYDEVLEQIKADITEGVKKAKAKIQTAIPPELWDRNLRNNGGRRGRR